MSYGLDGQDVLHFLHPDELEIGIACMHRWLVAGGKVFVLVNSTYLENYKQYAPHFEQNKRNGVRWPGWVHDIGLYSSHPTLEFIPKSIHLFDAEVLSRAFADGGFEIEIAKEYRRSGLPESLFNDGRENVMLVAHKVSHVSSY